MTKGAIIGPALQFPEAASRWLQLRGAIGNARTIRPNTEKSEAQYLRSLELFFGSLRLRDIHVGHIREYQRVRSLGAEPFVRKRRPQDKVAAPCPASAKKINQELALLARILKRAGCWHDEMVAHYAPLLIDEPEVPRALTPDEQWHWLETAKRVQPVVYWYSLLAFETTASTNELRALRVGDVNLTHEIISVPWPGAKNSRRHRSIPLVTSEGRWAAEQLLRRASELGASDPQHFLFPVRDKKSPHDPTRPMTVSGIKKPWQSVRDASGLRWFRPYDTRHTAITRLVEAGVHVEVIQSLAGHVSDKMRRHYTHVSQQSQRQQLAAAYNLGRRPVQSASLSSRPSMASMYQRDSHSSSRFSSSDFR